MDLVFRAAELFGSCRVVVMNNREKTYRFSLSERFEICRLALKDDPRITVDFYEGMLYEYLLNLPEEKVLVKGVRNEKDFLYERKMASFNLEHSGVETLYLDAKEELKEISSTVVRQKLEENASLEGLVSEKVIKLLQNKL
jgi:pantetheine-phosphate adenylyltransferase